MRLIDAYTLQNEIQKSKMENPHKDAKVAKNHEFEHDHFMRMVTLQPTAQEEKEPTEAKRGSVGGFACFVCGNCGVAITEGDSYCRHCGRMVDWK